MNFSGFFKYLYPQEIVESSQVVSMSINNWSIRFKLQVLSIVFGIGLFITGLVSFNTITELKSGLDEVGEIHLQSIYNLLELDKDLYQALSGILNATQYPAESAAFTDYIDYYRKQVDIDVPKKWKNGFLTLERLSTTADEKHIAGFETSFDDWKSAVENMVKLLKDSETTQTEIENLKAQISGTLFETMRDHVDKLSDATVERSKVNIADADQNNRRSKSMLTFIIFLSLGISLFLSTIITKSMLRQLRQVIVGLRDISKGEADLSARLALDSRDEIGELATWFDTFVEKLEGQANEQKVLQHQVQDSTNSLGSASKHLSEITTEISNKSTSIADMSNIVAAASEEMSVNMDTIAQASQASRQNMNSIENATGEMTSTVSEIPHKAEQAREITARAVQNVALASGRVDNLGDAAEQISKVTDTVVEIAEQTKLLALNATIEAARAGEAGKGFSVVAGEVKELATETNAATTDISHKIEAIQNETNGTVSEIASIRLVINEVSDIGNTIATAVEEQNVTTQDIASNVGMVNSGISDVVNNVTQGAKAAREVASNIATVNTDIGSIKKTGEDLNETTSMITDTGNKLKDVADRLYA